uniref:DET1 homolog [Megachile rotundata] n=1 Tax=Lepeophtheirus salmonis TaxID=72036 RepID=A0A0K2T8W2_LEPSM
MQKGCFIPIVKIGRLLEDDDEYLLSISREHSQKESSINALKHRILVFLYQRAMKSSLDQKHPGELRRFYQYFDQLKGLRIWKMQLIDEDHILLKYASEEVVTHRKSESNSQLSFFVIYDRKNTRILSIYDNNSKELVEIFEQHCDFFRNSSESRIASSPSNNVYAALIQKKFKRTISNAKNGSITEARKRILARLPISAQSCSSSPYLDLFLFSYDEKFVSVMERPKGCGDHPIQFYDRNTGRLMFKIYTGLQNHPSPPTSAKRLVAFVFHPTDPFVISVQRTLLDYVVNFHVRKAGVQGDTSPSFF